LPDYSLIHEISLDSAIIPPVTKKKVDIKEEKKKRNA